MNIDQFEKYYDFTIRCIDREDNLTHYRLTWALSVNTVLFGFVFASKWDNWLGEYANYFVRGASLYGILLTFFSLKAIYAAQNQLKYLMKSLEDAARKVDPALRIDSTSKMDHEKFNNIIHERTGYPRPFGDGSYLAGKHKFIQWGKWGASTYCWMIIGIWFGLLIFIEHIPAIGGKQ